MFPYAMCRGVRAVTADTGACGAEQKNALYVPAFSECHAPRGGAPGAQDAPADEPRQGRPGWCERPATAWASLSVPRFGAAVQA